MCGCPASHPDRNAQFKHINSKADDFLQRAQPVVSVDTKKKELVGDFKNAGREWQPKGQPEKSMVHDFPQDAAGKAIPYGIYDMGRNEAWVSVGCDHDTPSFAVASLRRWWEEMGDSRYREARELFITADAGGSNGHRSRARKHELQRFADDTGVRIHVSHFPPGTSKWNKIEHHSACRTSCTASPRDGPPCTPATAARASPPCREARGEPRSTAAPGTVSLPAPTPPPGAAAAQAPHRRGIPAAASPVPPPRRARCTSSPSPARSSGFALSPGRSNPRHGAAAGPLVLYAWTTPCSPPRVLPENPGGSHDERLSRVAQLRGSDPLRRSSAHLKSDHFAN